MNIERHPCDTCGHDRANHKHTCVVPRCPCEQYRDAIPYGPSRAEAIRLVVAAERGQWVAAMVDTVADLRKREASCQEMCSVARESTAAERLHAKASTYAHAATMLAADVQRLKEAP